MRRAGARWFDILTLAGSETSDRRVAIPRESRPCSWILSCEPTKVDRPSDVTGLVDTGELVGILGPDDATAVMESIYRLSSQKMTNVTADAVVKDMVRCGYLKAADVADRFGGTPLDPGQDPMIVGPAGIFSDAEFPRAA